VGESSTLADAHLSPETLLRLAPGLRTRFEAARHEGVTREDG
jgi:hypothetical protein